jgi:hypothetical protein
MIVSCDTIVMSQSIVIVVSCDTIVMIVSHNTVVLIVSVVLAVLILTTATIVTMIPTASNRLVVSVVLSVLIMLRRDCLARDDFTDFAGLHERIGRIGGPMYSFCMDRAVRTDRIACNGCIGGAGCPHRAACDVGIERADDTGCTERADCTRCADGNVGHPIVTVARIVVSVMAVLCTMIVVAVLAVLVVLDT